MRKTIMLTTLLTTALAAQADVFNFQPTPTDLWDLDHHYAYTWGIRFDLPDDHVITSAVLTFSDIYDWRREPDALFVRLLDDPRTGVRSYLDNSRDNVLLDYFASWGGTPLFTWSDPNGGYSTGFNLVYSFTTAQIATLTSYIVDPRSSTRADFGFSLDPDCHYYNKGITFSISTERTTVPDAASTFVLLGVGLLALPLGRRFARH